MQPRTQSQGSGPMFVAALFAFVALPAAAVAQEAPETPPAPETPQASECTIELEPVSLEAGAPAQQVQASLSSEIAEPIDGVQVQDESGLQVALVNPTALTLAIDASAANPGEWKIAALSGEAEVCAGSVRVAPGEQR